MSYVENNRGRLKRRASRLCQKRTTCTKERTLVHIRGSLPRSYEGDLFGLVPDTLAACVEPALHISMRVSESRCKDLPLAQGTTRIYRSGDTDVSRRKNCAALTFSTPIRYTVCNIAYGKEHA